jgi:hypothetical protein
MLKTRRGIVEQTATRFGKVEAILGHNRLPPPLGRRHRGRIAHINPQGLELWPGLGRPFLLQVLHLVKPAANAQGPGPDRINRFGQPHRAIGGKGHGRLETPLEQVPLHL